MGVAEDYQIFKSALVYTVTFRITQNLVQHPQHTDGDFVALLVCAFVATSLLQILGTQLDDQRKTGNRGQTTHLQSPTLTRNDVPRTASSDDGVRTFI